MARDHKSMILLRTPLALAVLSLWIPSASARQGRSIPAQAVLGGYDLPAPPETPEGVSAAPPQGAPVSTDEKYAADLGLSLARFSTKTKVGKFRGRFRRYEALAWVHPVHGSLSAVQVTLDMRSVDVDSRFVPRFVVNKILKADQFPTGSVRSLSVHPQPSGPAWVETEVTVCGKTYREFVAVTVERRDEDLRLTGSFSGISPAGNSGVLDFDLMLKKVSPP